MLTLNCPIRTVLYNWIVYLENGKIIDVKSAIRPTIPNARSMFRVTERTKWPTAFTAKEKED